MRTLCWTLHHRHSERLNLILKLTEHWWCLQISPGSVQVPAVGCCACFSYNDKENFVCDYILLWAWKMQLDSRSSLCCIVSGSSCFLTDCCLGREEETPPLSSFLLLSEDRTRFSPGLPQCCSQQLTSPLALVIKGRSETTGTFVDQIWIFCRFQTEKCLNVLQQMLQRNTLRSRRV